MKRVENSNNPEGQKFPKGQRVHIASDLGQFMTHFPNDKDATVRYTYFQAYGGDQEKQTKKYTLDVDGVGSVGWYYEHQLTAI